MSAARLISVRPCQNLFLVYSRRNTFSIVLRLVPEALVHCPQWIDGWLGLDGGSPKPRGFLRSAQSSPGHPTEKATSAIWYAAFYLIIAANATEADFTQSDACSLGCVAGRQAWLRRCVKRRFAGLHFTDGKLVQQVANGLLRRAAISFPTVL